MAPNVPVIEPSSPPPSANPLLTPSVADVYLQFSSLSVLARQRFNGELGGKLLLYGSLDVEGAALALAGNIGGAATLGIDSSEEVLKQGIRHGFCDFLVNNLDEALRILKNEVRKRQPVSVCLHGDLAGTLKDAVERGLQPDILAPSLVGLEVDTLVQRGAIAFQMAETQEASLLEVTWTAKEAPAKWLPVVDALAAEVLPAGDERRRWLKLAPRYLGRAMLARRYLQMTSAEADQLAGLIDAGTALGKLGTEITLLR